jgi:teichuronic acid biosynthesis glycosyltransferase TuaG
LLEKDLGGELKKMHDMSVNIILPNYNSSNYIDLTLKSIIDQDYKNWKLIIVDDSSDVKTKDILCNYLNHKNIQIIFLKKNKGQGFCRNLALRYSKSDFIAFIDSDDLWHREKLSNQIVFMEKNNYDFTYTNYDTFRDDNLKKNKSVTPPLKFNFESFINNTSIATSSMVIRGSLAKKAKFTRAKSCDDYYYKCKLIKNNKLAHCLNKTLTYYRIRNNSIQSSKLRNLIWIWKINRDLNKLNIFRNLISIFFITVNSIRKYGIR